MDSSLTVIIPNYNNVKGLQYLLSYFKEKPYKVVVVDNSKKNLGFAGGVNEGAKEAKTKWLLILNDDIEFEDKITNNKSQITNKSEIEKYINECKNKTDIERTAENKEKTGVELKGVKAINPATGEKIPIWIADYILASYGTGAVMAVPAHDERDFEFAKKYNLPIADKPLIPLDEATKKFGKKVTKYKLRDWVFSRQRYWGEPIPLIHCFQCAFKEHAHKSVVAIDFQDHEGFLRMKSRQKTMTTRALNPEDEKNFYGNVKAGDIITASDNKTGEKILLQILEVRKFGSLSDLYKDKEVLLKSFGRDFVTLTDLENQYKNFRENYVEKMNKNGAIAFSFKILDEIVPVPEKDLPVKLPKVSKYEPTGTGEGPLASVEKWVNVKCPKCRGKAKRETNTMPQWAGSSWYWMRYMDPKNKKEFASLEKQKYWSPVDLYFGGMEHTTLHLLYSRFWNLFLYDQKLVAVKEPYKKRVPHGIILAPDGDKMSKSKGNFVNPDTFIDLYGADTTRLHMMFLGPHEAQVAWNDKGIVGARRFLERVWNIRKFISETESAEVTTGLHKMIKKVSEDLETFSFNTAVSAMMIFANVVYEVKSITSKSYQEFLKILSPFAPHISEELWLLFVNKRSIYKESWPEWNPELIKEKTVNIAVQINGRVRLEIQVGSDSDDETVKAAALAHKKIADLVLNKTICKIIVVKNRLINIVI